MTAKVTPAPTSKAVPEGMLSVPAIEHVSLVAFQVPPREPGHTVEPFEVVIEIVVVL
jgi:hypothetical protein